MSLQIGLREANQHLAQYIEAVELGEEVVITRRGQSVARLVPIQKRSTMSKAQKEAWVRTIKRMKKGFNLGGKNFTRDDFYER